MRQLEFVFQWIVPVYEDSLYGDDALAQLDVFCEEYSHHGHFVTYAAAQDLDVLHRRRLFLVKQRRNNGAL